MQYIQMKMLRVSWLYETGVQVTNIDLKVWELYAYR